MDIEKTTPTISDKIMKCVIKEDCEYLMNLYNKRLIYKYIDVELREDNNSKENKMYYLYVNNAELWFGTLQEINAVVKSLIKLKEMKAKYSLVKGL